jgi:catechol 2,3-dioxygenase-like lactoylglutathione lyase family enzyme
LHTLTFGFRMASSCTDPPTRELIRPVSGRFGRLLFRQLRPVKAGGLGTLEHTGKEDMMAQPPVGPLGSDVAVTHILVVTDPVRSRDFWVQVLGAELYREYGGTSVVLRFSGTWLLLVSGGGPTADKPTVVFAPPADPDRVSHAMTLRVADCQAAYQALRSRGATFLTPPHDWGTEIRCFLRDPDGHLIEISQSTST